MIVIDYVIAEQAELLNAWSVIQRLFGQQPDAGESTVYQYAGATGEFITVMVFNLFVAVLLTAVIKFIVKQRNN